MSALDTFRRAMRRHEKRARRRCGPDAAASIAEMRRTVVRWWPGLGNYTGASDLWVATALRGAGERTEAFILERAVDALTRLRGTQEQGR